MGHRTKDKGDQGLGRVICDLMTSDIKICLPMSDHLPFDLIAVSPTGDLRRVQVKYKVKRKGTVSVNLRKQLGGGKMVHFDRAWVDAYAVYCPDTLTTYYIRSDEIGANSIFTLRLDPPRGADKRTHMASQFVGASRIFASVGQW